MFVTFEHFTFSLTYLPMIVSHNEIFTLKLICNKFEDFIHFSMTYLLRTSEAFGHFWFLLKWQQYAKVSVKMISESHVFHKSIQTSCEVRYLPQSIAVRNSHTHHLLSHIFTNNTQKHLSIERHFNISSNWSHSQINTNSLSLLLSLSLSHTFSHTNLIDT